MMFRIRRKGLLYGLYQFSYFFQKEEGLSPRSLCPLARRVLRAIVWTTPIWLLLEAIWLLVVAPIAVTGGVILGYYPNWTMVMPSNCYPRHLRKKWDKRPSFHKMGFLPRWYRRVLGLATLAVALYFYLPYAWEGLWNRETAHGFQALAGATLAFLLAAGACVALILIGFVTVILAEEADVPDRWKTFTGNVRVVYWAIKDRFCPLVQVVD